MNVKKSATNKNIEFLEEKSFKKHVAAIHAGNPLTLIQRKLANALLYHAYPNLLVHEEHIISIKELCDLIGFESHAIEQIKTALRKLLSTVIEWNLVDKEKETKETYWAASTILASVEIKGSVCRYAYSKHLREMLFQPEIFASLNMAVLKSFKSSYALALYENCVRFKNVRQTKWFDLPLFRKLMGVSEKKYAQFSDLKKRVIDAAVEEINENKLSQVFLTPEFKQEGRVVKAIKFHISEKNEIKTHLEHTLSTEERGLLGVLVEELNIDIETATEFISKYEASYILEKIKYTMSAKSFKAGTMSYPAQYLKKALEENYQAPKSSADLLREASKKREAEQRRQQAITKQVEEKKSAYTNYKNEFIMKKFDSFQEKEKKEYLKLFSKKIMDDSTPLLQNLFNRSGLRSPIVRAQFVSFLLEINPNMLNDMLSFESYTDQLGE